MSVQLNAFLETRFVGKYHDRLGHRVPTCLFWSVVYQLQGSGLPIVLRAVPYLADMARLNKHEQGKYGMTDKLL